MNISKVKKLGPLFWLIKNNFDHIHRVQLFSYALPKPSSHSFKENHKVNLTKTVFGVQFKCQGIARIRILYH
jgi:hypothetical protein